MRCLKKEKSIGWGEENPLSLSSSDFGTSFISIVIQGGRGKGEHKETWSGSSLSSREVKPQYLRDSKMKWADVAPLEGAKKPGAREGKKKDFEMKLCP